MARMRRLLLSRIGPELDGAAVLQPLMTGVGVFIFIAGVLYLPSLGPTRVEMITLLLLLAAVALLCHVVGQLALFIERLDRRSPITANDSHVGSTSHGGRGDVGRE